MENYEINENTLAIIPLKGGKSKIIEKERELIINQTPMEIIDYSCLYFGSSYDGRHSATKHLLGITYKSPIIVEESRNMIFFPTNSPRLFECYWIALKHIVDYKKSKNESLKEESIISFNSGIELQVPISYGSLDNQVLRATRLESVFRNKKKIS